MSEVTLVLTRTPLQEFIFTSRGNKETDDLTDEARSRLYHSKRTPLDKPPDVTHKSGRWGTLALVRGPKIQSVTFVEAALANVPVAGGALGAMEIAGRIIMDALTTPLAQGGIQAIPFAGRVLELVTDSKPVELLKEYTSMERFRSDHGSAKGGYVQLHPRPEAYPLRFESNNSVVKKMRPGHSGKCIRVLDTRPGPESGILIHEAPHVGWLIGCISPRPKGNRMEFENRDGNPSFMALNEIINEMLKHAGGRGSLYVLDS
jgi:hypothetical protein